MKNIDAQEMEKDGIDYVQYRTNYAVLVMAGRRALRKIGFILSVGLIVVAILSWASKRIALDDTDGDAASGMGLHTDARTGCQYLSTYNGGITPRLDENGHHICIEVKK